MPGKKAFGIQLMVEISTVWTAIANVTNLDPIDDQADIIDMSSHDSPNEYREKEAGFKDAGDVTLELNYDPANTTHQKVEDILATSTAFKLRYAGAPVNRAQRNFNAILKSFKVGAPHDGKYTATAVLTISGKPTWGAVA